MATTPTRCFLLLVLLAIVTTGCVSYPVAVVEEKPRVDFAIAIHGGAGVIPKDIDPARKQRYIDSLTAALELGREHLAQGGTSLDAVEAVVRALEDDELFNAGKGAVFTNAGTHQLDAAIMDGSDLGCGAVSSVETVRNPITLARAVMEQTRHVFLVGGGAEQFAAQLGMKPVEQSYFFTKHRHEQWQKKVRREREVKEKGTVGCVALDKHGNLAAATSTGGLTNKKYGRVGDVPVIGAGTYANNRTCAVSCTGTGEEFIRHTVARDIAALMEYRGMTLKDAATEVIHGKLAPGDGGMIGVAANGSIALVFNSPGMFRGAADSTGRFEVKIWE